MQVSHQWPIKRSRLGLQKFDRCDSVLIHKHGKRKAFHTGGNSSSRLHIRQHYGLYKEHCKANNIPEQHWAIPQTIWKKLEDEWKSSGPLKQSTLDASVWVGKSKGPSVFTRENLLQAVTQFIAVDDQVRLRS